MISALKMMFLETLNTLALDCIEWTEILLLLSGKQALQIGRPQRRIVPKSWQFHDFKTNLLIITLAVDVSCCGPNWLVMDLRWCHSHVIIIIVIFRKKTKMSSGLWSPFHNAGSEIKKVASFRKEGVMILNHCTLSNLLPSLIPR